MYPAILISQLTNLSHFPAKFCHLPGTLTLQFSRPVKLSSVSLSRIFLSNAAVNATTTVQLTQATVILSTTLPAPIQSTAVTLSLNGKKGTTVYPTVKDKIHLSKKIGLSVGTTWLRFSVGFACSIDGMFVSESVASVQVLSVVLDTTPPSLLSFSVDFSLSKMTLLFSKPVYAASLVPSGLTLSSDPASPQSPQYTLTTSSVIYSESVGSKVLLSLSLPDTLGIFQYSPYLCSSVSNCFLSFPSGIICDIAPLCNPIGIVFFPKGMMTSLLTVDTTSPVILHYDVSLTEGTLDLFFSKVIHCQATRVTYVIFQKAQYLGSSNDYFRLTSSSTVHCTAKQSETASNHIRIYLNDDLTILKTFSSLLKSKSNTFLRVEAGAFVQDRISNIIQGIPDGLAVQVSNYTGDSIPPQLTSFSVALGGVLSLRFSEPINSDSVNIAMFALQNNFKSNSVTYSFPLTLKSVFLSQSNFHRNQEYDIMTDYDIVSSLSNIFTSQDSTYIRVTAGAVSDYTGNIIAAVPSSSAIQVGPAVYKWTINMNTGLLSLYFSDPVFPYFTVHGFGVQNSHGFGNLSVALSTNHAVNQSDPSSTVYTISLARTDLNLIKYGHMGGARTFLTVPFGVTTGTAVNTFVPNLKSVQIRNTSALKISDFISDTTPPVCLYYDIDMGEGTVTLTFDEPVSPLSLLLLTLTLSSPLSGRGMTFKHPPLNAALRNITQLVVNVSFLDMSSVRVATYGINGLGSSSPLSALQLDNKAVTDYAGMFCMLYVRDLNHNSF